ncbi:hypothetical protein OW967_25730, partial [Klebsiella pneumoniae]
MQVGESVVNAIVEYHAQGSEEAHAEENRMFLRYLHELTGTQRVAVEVARKYFSPVRADMSYLFLVAGTAPGATVLLQ